MDFENNLNDRKVNHTGIIKWMWWLYVAVAFGVVFIMWWMFMEISSHDAKIQENQQLSIHTIQNPNSLN